MEKDTDNDVPELFKIMQNIRQNAEAMHRPAGYYNNSQYNDVLNYAPSEYNPSYDSGRQDEYGNPIRASLINDYYNGPAAQQAAAPKEAQPLGGNILETVSNTFNNTAAGMRKWRESANEGIAVNMEQDPLSAIGSGIMWLHDAVKNNATDNFKTTKVYADLFYGAEERRELVEKATEMYKQGLIAIDPENLPRSNSEEASETWAKMMKQMQFIEKLQDMKEAVPGAVTPDGQVDMRKILSAFPEVKDILETRGTNAAVMALHEIKGLKSVHDAYNNDVSRFIGSVGIGIERGINNFAKQMVSGKAMVSAMVGLRDKEGLTKNEREYLRGLDKANESLSEYSYSTVGAGFGGMIGSAIENMPMIISSQLARMAAGAGLVAAGVSAPVAATVGAAAAIAVMGFEIGGNQYEQNINKVDKDGRRMYTSMQAGWISALQGGAEGWLEVNALSKIFGAVKGRAAVRDLASLYNNGAAETLALSVGKNATEEEIKQATRAIVSDALKGMAEAGVVSFKAELLEEFEQQVSDMVIENMAQLALKGEKAELSSVQDILGQSIMAAAEAVPAVAGFGFMGMAGHAGVHRNQLFTPRNYLEGLQGELAQNVLHNQDLIEKIEAVGSNLENIAELQGKAPEVVQQILDSNNERSGIKTSVINIKALKQEEGGQAILDEIAKRANISADELAACEAGTGLLTVDTSFLMQVSSTAEDAGKKALFRNVTKEGILKTNAMAEAEIEEMKKVAAILNGKADIDQEDAIEKYAKGMLKDNEQVQRAMDILRADIEHPHAELKKRLKDIQAEIDAELEGTMASLKNGMKQGVDVIQNDQGGVRVSNNAPWYQNFFADNGRAPTQAELEQIAYENATGQATRYADMSYDGSPEEQQYFAETKAKLDALFKEREALQELEPNLRWIQPGDVIAASTLSTEGVNVYRQVKETLLQGNDKVRASAALNALFFAREAERAAKFHQEAGETNYTAENYLMGIVANAQTADQSLAQMQSQMEAVRQQYEGTAQWMKAPNGQDTNLTERQWLQVRTPAFKAWFGDWENDPANASKVVDENGEPLVVYHGTNAYEIKKFKLGKNGYLGGAIYTTRERAYAERYTDYGSVYDLFLNVKNPILVEGGNEPAKKLLQQIYGDDKGSKLYDKRIAKNDRETSVISKADIKKLKELGYDGVEWVVSGTHEYAAYEPNQVKSAVDNNGNFSLTDDNIYHQMAGEKANTFPLFAEKLDQAKAMLQDGKTAEEIWQATGWMRGADEKWRFEIPDNMSDIYAEGFIAEGTGTRWSLGHLYKNDDLYLAYPFLWNVKVQLTSDLPSNTNGRADFEQNIILINSSEKLNAEDLKKTLIHEIQHFIQEYEDFASGGNMEMAAPIAQKQLEDFMAANTDERLQQYKNVLERAQEAKQVQAEDRMEGNDLAKENPELFQEMQEAIKEAEELEKKLQQEAENDEAFAEKFYKLRRLVWRATNPFIAYESLAGEQEARATANRAASIAEYAKAYQLAKVDREEIELVFKKAYEAAAPELQKAMDEFIAVYNNGETTEEHFADVQRMEDAINSTKAGQALTEQFYAVEMEKFYEEDAADTLERAKKHMPYVHGADAIIVFNGQEFGAASQKKRKNKPKQTIRPGDVKLEADNEIWGGIVQKYLEDQTTFAQPKTVMQTPLVFDLIDKSYINISYGYPIKIAPSIMKKVLILTEAEGGHADKINVNDFANLPKLLADPVMILKNRDGKTKQIIPGELLVIVEAHDKAGAIINVPIVFTKTSTYYSVKSFFGRNSDLSMLERMMLHDVMYINKEKTAEWQYSGRQQLPMALSISGSFKNIPNEKDLVKLKEAYPDYYQQEAAIKGAYSQTQNIIALFQAADQSTFMHESAHAYLEDLRKLAEQYPDSTAAKEYATIMAWAAWKDGDAAAYAKTASADVFRKLEKEIKEAEKNGYVERTINGQKVRLTADEVKHEWAQERFARAFEEYLKSGEAPASTLKQAFRKFKAWLTRIYKDVTGAGVRASAEVEAIMARMVASDEEIENYALVKRAERIQDIDADLLDTDTQAMLQRWEDEAKEKAKEKLLADLMKQYAEQDVKEHMDKFRPGLEKMVQGLKVFKAQAAAEAYGEDIVVDLGFYTSVDEYKQDLARHGGSMERLIETAMQQEEERYKKQMPADLRQRAEDAYNSGALNAQIAALEAEILGRRIEKYTKAPRKLAEAMNDVEQALAQEDKPLEKAILALKYAFRWEAKQAEKIALLQDLVQELKWKAQEEKADLKQTSAEEKKALRDKLQAEKKDIRDKMAATIKELKAETMQNKAWLRGVRDAANGKARAHREAARQKLANMPIREASNTRAWIREADKAGRDCMKALTAAMSAKDDATKQAKYKEAQEAKLRQAAYNAMAAESIKLKRSAERMVNAIKRRAKAAPKNKHLDAQNKYYLGHVLYMFKLKAQDNLKPAGLLPLPDLLKNLATMGFDCNVDPAIINEAGGVMPGRKHTDLNIMELQEVRDLVDFLYVSGVNLGKLLTTDEYLPDVVMKLMQAHDEATALEQGRKAREKNGINDYMLQLLKPEVMLKLMDSKQGLFVNYIYQPLFDGQEQKRILSEKSAEQLKAILDAWLPMAERNKLTEVVETLFDEQELTKENIVAMALNWGNAQNKQRLLAGLNYGKNPNEQFIQEADVLAVFEKHLSANDWNFVQQIWDYVGQYGDDVNKVVQDCTGNPMERVQAEAFDVKTADGQVVNMSGGYYPIKRDPAKSSIQQELEVQNQASGGQVLGMSMGSTKSRAKGPVNMGPLMLELNVISRHVDQQIHIITMRKACLDSYRLLRQTQVADMITQQFGERAHRVLLKWVEDVWHEPMGEGDLLSGWGERVRANTVKAIMAYRVSTAMLNFANIAPMADRLGVANTVKALAQFMAHPRQMREFVMNDSAFMRSRAENMDRDLRTQQSKMLGGNKYMEAIDKYANWLIAETDLLCGVPTYNFAYQESYSKAIAEGKSAVEAAKQAHFDAHEAVRSVLGSADSIDQAAIQRNKSLFIKALTPFYSFFNAQMNAVWAKYYQGRYEGQTIVETDAAGNVTRTPVKEAFMQRYKGFAYSWLMRFVIMAGIETAIRAGLAAVSAGHDDKPEKGDLWERFIKQWAINSVDSASGGFPVLNGAVSAIFYGLMGESKMASRGVADAGVERLVKPFEMLAKEAGKGKGIDVLEFARLLTKGVGGSWYGVPDTLTDATFNTVRFMTDDYKLMNPDDLREYIGRSLLDKKLKAK